MSFKVITRAFAVVMGVALAAGATAVRSDLSQESEITEALINAAMAYGIQEYCPEIDLREIRAINDGFALIERAREMGYSDDEIRAYVDNDAEKARIEAIARQRLLAMGAVEGRSDTICAIGYAEIAKESAIGNLLR